jgi:hypothetical protein
MNRRRSRWSVLLLAAAYAAGSTATMVMAWLPIPVTIDRFLYEDFFYYLRIAENVLAGRGASFDGVAATNGFHPLWELLCIALRACSTHDVAPHLVLAVASAIHVAQSLVLWRIVARAGSTGVAHFTALFHLWNWRVAASNLCGLETPAAGLAVLLVIDYLTRDGGRRGGAWAVGLGALLGLAVLARFDLLLLAASVLLWMAFRPDPQRRLGARVLLAAVAAVVLSLLLVPWIVWSVRHSSAVLPNSRVAVALDMQNRWDPQSSFPENLHALRLRLGWVSWWLTDTLNLLGVLPIVAPEDRKIGGAGLLLVLALSALAIVRQRPGWDRPFAVALGGYAIVHIGYYCLLYRAEVRYLFPAILVLMALLARSAAAFFETAASRSKRIVMQFAGVALLVNSAASGAIAIVRHQGTTRTHAAHRDLYDMALWLRDNTHADAVIGSLNAGILGYFSQRTVVNLDGVVNDEALRALESCTLPLYAARRGVDLYVDLDGAVESFVARFGPPAQDRPDLPLLHRIGVVTARLRR